MKKILILFFALCFLCVGTMALADEGNHNGWRNRTGISNSNINLNQSVNTNTNTNTNVNTNTSTSSANSDNKNINYGDERDVLNTAQIIPFEIPMYQFGRIGDYTASLPNFANMSKLGASDVILRILEVYSGSWLSRIRFEDLEMALLERREKLQPTIEEKKVNVAKIRYRVTYKDGVSSGGVGGGAAGNVANGDGLSSATGSVLPGYHSSTHNPQFIITFYEVK
jgi:hypothetical protein